MQKVSKDSIITMDNKDYIILEETVKNKSRYLLLQEVDKEENLLDTQVIARLIKINSRFALEDIDDRFLLKNLRNDFANKLRQEYVS